jgi:hypothetical protein
MTQQTDSADLYSFLEEVMKARKGKTRKKYFVGRP